jgi:hypothetical protein
MTLTPTERRRVAQALAIQRPDKLVGAEELHQFVHHYNWDGGIRALQRTLKHPACDRGTALMMFWLSEPTYAYERYASIDEAVIARDVNLESLRFAEEVLHALRVDKFATRRIGYIPPSPIGQFKRPFGEAVMLPSPGEPQPRQSLHDISIESFGAAERAILDKHFSNAVSGLRKQSISVNPTDDPQAIVLQLQEFTLKLPDRKPPPSKPALSSMGYLFAHQIHRAFDADWLVRCVNDDRMPLLYTKDLAIALKPDRPVSVLTDRSMGQFYTLEGLFWAFGKVVPAGANFEKLLSPEESRHLFRDAPGTWPVWGVQWKLPPYQEA